MKHTANTFLLSATDLVNFAGCKHQTELDRSNSKGEIPNPDWSDPAVALLQKKGQEHEEAYLKALILKGHSVYKLSEYNNEATLNAMKAGHDYIYQASLSFGSWNGRADFLRKVLGGSVLGNYHYEIEDTKLAQETKAGTVLQLCLYSEMLAQLQEIYPENMYVIKPGGGFPTDTYRYTDFHAYYRLIKAEFEHVIQNPPQKTYPLPVSKCAICRWWKECDNRWHHDDHLSLIAGIRSLHLNEIETQGIKTLAAYASESSPLKTKPRKGNPETFTKIHNQSKVQLKGRKAGKVLYELLPIENERGFNRLPIPSDGDLYFDIEGDHFYEDGGMEYLLGFGYKTDGELTYQGLWAKNRKEEKKCFEEFIDFVMNQWKKCPGLYIYHYAPYEPTALKRLATFHATRELEIDILLRAERFVDLFSVLKEAIQVSVESYSLKEVEALTTYTRKADLRLASAARRRISTALELKSIDFITEPDIQVVEEYNKDDCMATAALHVFLEDLYQKQLESGYTLTRPENKDGSASDTISEKDEEARQLFDALIHGLSEDRDSWTQEEKSRWLLAHLIEYYRRESKSSWWEYYRIQDLEHSDLFDERNAIAGLEFIGTHADSKQVPIHLYSYPPQEVALSEGDEVNEVPGGKIGSVHSISPETNQIAIKKTKVTSETHPVDIQAGNIVSANLLANSLKSFIQSILNYGFDGNEPYKAGKDLLLQNAPRLKNNESILPMENESTEQTALRVLINLDNSILPIQGPPGTGKTHTGSNLIVELVRQGKRVGITAVSHSVIVGFLEKVKEQGMTKGVNVSVKHKVSSSTTVEKGDPFKIKKNEDVLEALQNRYVIGGTSWLWADDKMEDQLDYLFVDEAGQMSLANVLAVSRSTRNLVLLGDPQQLEQPQKGAHPEGSDVSALQHIIGEHQTIPANKGIFLNTTWRLNPKIAAFTSEIYYESRLKSKENLSIQAINGNTLFKGSGLFSVSVAHIGNQNSSPEEVHTITEIVAHLIKSGLTWTASSGAISPVQLKDILIVAPYNAQVNALSRALPECRVGTVDKFQGKEAPVVIYSMTSSSPEDAPRGMSFLYNPNRLNVATSRAKCICILVASPELFKPECHSIDQMRWANGLCRYGEMAFSVSL